jgi:hypothetical protein
VSTPIFYVHVQARGVEGEIRLNDAPVLPISTRYSQHAFPTISEWVVDGENQLSVHIDDSEEGASLHIALCQANLGDVPEPGNEDEIAVIDWPPAPPTPGEGGEEIEAPAAPPLPPELRATGFASHPWGRWSWQESPPFSADLTTTAELIAYVRDLHATLATGSVDTLAADSQVKFSEVAPVYDMSVAEAEARLRDTWSYVTALPGWQLAPFDEADIELRLRCDGQLVEPCTLDGEPILRQARPIDGDVWSMPIFIARTNWEYLAGQLTIVR